MSSEQTVELSPEARPAGGMSRLQEPLATDAGARRLGPRRLKALG
jgi:hypothetical protein